GPGALFAGTTTDSAADDVIHRSGRVSHFRTGEARRSAGDRGHPDIRIAQQTLPNHVCGHCRRIDAGGDNAVRGDERPRTQIDVVQSHIAVSAITKSEFESGSRIRAIGPAVVRPIAVIPAGRSPAYISRPIHPVDPCRRVGIAGNPDPAKSTVISPTTIVIGHPSPGLVRDPDKATAAVAPISVVVRAPADGDIRTPAP